MKTLEEMTPGQLRALADRKEQEEREAKNKPSKEAYIKEDVYVPLNFSKMLAAQCGGVSRYLVNKEELQKIADNTILNLKEMASEAVNDARPKFKSGEKFYYYPEKGWIQAENVGEHDCYYTFSWAAQYLGNVKDLE